MVPSLRDSVSLYLLSGTHVPGFPVAPLRGWAQGCSGGFGQSGVHQGSL